MSHLESLIVEYLDWQGYLVRRNTKVGRLKHGGWEMELDVIGYNPHNNDLVHYEPSVDAHAWETREARYAKKFEAARKLIFTEVFSWLPPETPLRQIAVFPSHPKNRDVIAGGQRNHGGQSQRSSQHRITGVEARGRRRGVGSTLQHFFR